VNTMPLSSVLQFYTLIERFHATYMDFGAIIELKEYLKCTSKLK
jgi:hypothetical protein